MQDNAVKRRLADGGVALGTMVFEFGTTGIARIAAAAGAEFVVFDMEHNGWSIETVRTLFATARAAEVVPMVRVPAAEYHLLARPLDVGAMGLMVPMVESAAQARRFVEYSKYPPVGRRGAGFGMAHDDYRTGNIVEKMAHANRELLLIAQIETAAGVEHVEEIAGTDGIDVLWIGHNDLSTSLGIPGEMRHPRYLEAVERVRSACQDHRKALGFMASSIEEGSRLIQWGARCIAYGGDIHLYRTALSEGIAALREVGQG
jgi:2-keto-3-deoxy-L-rhamnonate aldolase RhmA